MHFLCVTMGIYGDSFSFFFSKFKNTFQKNSKNFSRASLMRLLSHLGLWCLCSLESLHTCEEGRVCAHVCVCACERTCVCMRVSARVRTRCFRFKFAYLHTRACRRVPGGRPFLSQPSRPPSPPGSATEGGAPSPALTGLPAARCAVDLRPQPTCVSGRTTNVTSILWAFSNIQLFQIL